MQRVFYYLQHDSEFASEYLTQRPNRTKRYQMKMEFSNYNLSVANSIDWRKKGIVSSVKYQVCNGVHTTICLQKLTYTIYTSYAGQVWCKLCICCSSCY